LSLSVQEVNFFSGKVNTNVAYIGARISEIGLELSSVISVGDKKI